ncbi:tetratricopeptide repeat protein [Vibrio sp. SM6]|uniref:Tetratricopeptide repeat protein n=1 Tax=Vibrio agarilyticus TaxID=2726741 RepID=A0A7X8YF99_9VIBR|nr:SirB1 family protein [Vibrio agarilyticus]NLS11648.1 tetratricopeptide repeat protein [Vibrio agarilyticus]
MFEYFDEDFDAMELAEGALTLNQAVDPETDVAWAKSELERLVKEAEQLLFMESDAKGRFDAFLRLFYQEWAFRGDRDAYFDSANSFIDKVLLRRRGVPVSLGAIFLYIGRKLGFPLEGVTFPTQFLVKIRWYDEAPRYLNPFEGEYVSEKVLAAWLIGSEGPLAKMKPEYLRTVDNPTVIGRWLAMMKSALLREGRYTLALRCTDLALTFVPDDPYEIRDRGFIYQQLDCYDVAAMDFQYFIDQCPEDPAADILKAQVSAMSHKLTTLH